MELEGPIVDIDSVRLVEAACRKRVEGQPDDHSARLGLARCLFIEALHQAQSEHAVRQAALDPPGPCAWSGAGPGADAGGSTTLMRECLHHTVAVRHLSADPRHHEGVEELRALAALSGWAGEVRQADEEAHHVLRALAEACASAR